MSLTGKLKGDASCHCTTPEFAAGWDLLYGTDNDIDVKIEDWTDSFITKEGSEFVCWDETQAHVIGCANNREDAVTIVENYSEYLKIMGVDLTAFELEDAS